MSNINLGGVSSGGSRPSLWAAKQRLKDIILSSVAGATLDLRFTSKSYYRKDLTNFDADYVGDYAPGVEFFATHSRASAAWYPEWDFQSGSKVGRLTEYGPNERRGGSFGVLDEGAGTNHIRNPRAEGAVAGTPGTLPTNWSTSGEGALVREVVGSGSYQGWPYVDIRFSGTATTAVNVLNEAVTQVAASPGQSWTMSRAIMLVSGSLANVSSVYQQFNERSAAGASLVAEIGTSFKDAIDGELRVFSQTHSLANGSTERVSNTLVVSTTGAVDFTLRMSLPQLEQASSPSSPILPPKGAPAVSTRAADVVTGVTVDRASGGTYDDTWDYSNGGLTGNLTEFLPDVPRVGRKGLLIEEGTTNEIRNPRAEGGSPGILGSGGVLPTNWALSTGGGTGAAEVVSVSAEEIEIRFTGNPAGTAVVYFDSTTAIPVVNGDPYTMAVDVKMSAGSLNNVIIVRVGAYWHSAAGGYVGQSPGQEIKTNITSRYRRFYESSTVSNASHERARPSVYFTTSGDVDFTLKFRRPQFEDKAYPTSLVLPPKGTMAASTRATEIVTLSQSGWWNPSAVSVFMDMELNQGGALPGTLTLGRLGDTSADSVHYIVQQADGDLQARVRAAGFTEVDLNSNASGPITDPGTNVRFAYSMVTDDFHGAIKAGDNPVGTVDDTSVTVPTPASADFRFESMQGGYFVRAARLWPFQLPDADVDALVA